MKMALIISMIILSTCFSGDLTEKWDSPEGISRLQRSGAKENFWKLIRFYESQIHPSYCSVASSVIALNTLSVQSTDSTRFGDYRMFTQREFFTDKITGIIDQQIVAKRGMALHELSQVLKSFPIQVSTYEAQSLSSEKIRSLLIEALKNPDQCVLTLYQRKELNQVGGGHWSPLAAYDEQSDSFLLLDVAKYKYPPTWIDASAFISSMQTPNIHDQSRGFLILERK